MLYLKKSTLVLFIILAIPALKAQESENTYHRLYWGVEQDPLHYIFKGWGATGWLGLKRVRMSATYAEAQTPAFFRQKGIGYEHTRVQAVRADFFIKNQFKGLWIGAGFGYWWNRLQHQDFPYYTENGSVVFNLSSGYNIFIFKGLYIAPFLGGHLRISGLKPLTVGDSQLNPRLFTPEISLKIGWRF